MGGATVKLKIASIEKLAKKHGWTIEPEPAIEYLYVTHGNRQVRFRRVGTDEVKLGQGFSKYEWPSGSRRGGPGRRHPGGFRLLDVANWLHGAMYGRAPTYRTPEKTYQAIIGSIYHGVENDQRFGFANLYTQVDEPRAIFTKWKMVEGDKPTDLAIFRQAAAGAMPGEIFWDWLKDRFDLNI